MSGACKECESILDICDGCLRTHFKQLEKQLSDLQEKYDRAVEVVLLSRSTMHLSRCSIGHEEYCNKIEEFLKSIEENK